MRIGVYIHEHDPSIGGAFTFVDTVFSSFLLYAKESDHQFIVLCTAAAAKVLKVKIGNASNIEIAVVARQSAWILFWVRLKHFFPILVTYLQRFNSIEKLARRKKIDLVWFVSGWIYDTLSVPYVATVWDLQHRTHPWFPEVSAKGEWEYRETVSSQFLRRASHIITGTETGKEQIAWFYQVPPERISIIPHPISESSSHKLSQSLEELFPEHSFFNKPYFFYPAQFWPHKNHVNLLHALKILKEKYNKDVNLVFTGSDKGNLNHVRLVSAQLGLNNNVFPLGFVSQEQLIALYKEAQALVYVSFSGPENLPPLEAFALACPVVYSDFPGAKEQLGEACLFVDPHHPESIADKMKLVLDDAVLRETLIAKGKAQLKGRDGRTFVMKVFQIFDKFELIRRTWA